MTLGRENAAGGSVVSALTSPRVLTSVLWGVCLGGLIAGFDSAQRSIRLEAAERAILLLPAAATNDETRKSLIKSLREKPQIASAVWISPKQLAQQTSGAVARELWPTVFDEDEAWLPWVARARLADPVIDRGAIPALTGDLRADGDWDLVLFDSKGLENDAARWLLVFRLGAGLGALIFVLGAISMGVAPAVPGGGVLEAAAAGGLTLALGAVGGLIALGSGFETDGRLWGLGLGSGFALAALISPMIKRVARKPNTKAEPADDE